MATKSKGVGRGELFKRGGKPGPGRPVGSVSQHPYHLSNRAVITRAAAARVLKKFLTLAEAGDVSAASFCFRYSVPEVKPAGDGLIELAGDKALDKIESLVAALTQRQLAAAEGAIILRGLQILAVRDAAESEGRAVTYEEIVRLLHADRGRDPAVPAGDES